MARFRSSRLSVVPFCQEEGVSVSSFYQWRKKLAQLPQPITEVDQPESSFTPVRLVASPSVSVRLPGGTQLDVPTADPQLFQLALQTLAQIDAQRIQG
jgi:hypothetical protein